MSELLLSWLQSSLTSKNLKVQSKGKKEMLKGTNDKVTITAGNEIQIKVMIHLETFSNKLEFLNNTSNTLLYALNSCTTHPPYKKFLEFHLVSVTTLYLSHDSYQIWGVQNTFYFYTHLLEQFVLQLQINGKQYSIKVSTLQSSCGTVPVKLFKYSDIPESATKTSKSSINPHRSSHTYKFTISTSTYTSQLVIQDVMVLFQIAGSC